MISPHSLFLFLILVVAVGSFACYRFRPRAFMKTVRWIDERSGFAIVILGLTVLVCGCLGFATVGTENPETANESTLSMQVASQQDGSAGPGSAQSVPLLEAKEGTASIQEQASAPNEGTSLAGAIYETFQIFAFNVEHSELERSFLLRIAMIAAILLATMVASKGIAVLFHQSYEEIGLRFKSMHVVVCGLGRIGRQILADLEAMKSEFQIVVIEPDEDNKNIQWAREMGAVVLIGDATRTEMLEAARVQRAREVFVVTGSDECNIESVIEIRDIVDRKGRKGRFGQTLPKLRCHVHILNKDLAEIVRDKSLQLERHPRQQRQETGKPGQEYEQIDVEVFNALERTARRLLEDISAHVLTGSMATGKSDGSQQIDAQPIVLHYIMFGFGNFGQTLSLKLAELSHFPSCMRSRMSVIDTDIAKKAEAFTARHPAFCAKVTSEEAWQFDARADAWESKQHRPSEESQLENGSPGIEYVCNARFVEYRDIADDTMIRQIKRVCGAPNVQPTILVCFEEDRENFARAERLRTKLNSLGIDWPIFVWIPRQRELSQLLSEHRQQTRPGTTHLCQLIPFGQCYGSVSYNEINDSWMDWLARHIHLVWMQPSDRHWTDSIGKLQSALRDDNGLDLLKCLDWEEFDKTAKLVWEERSEWERASNRSCAVHAVLKAASLGLIITGYNTRPKPRNSKLAITPRLEEQLRMMEHYRWVAERLLAGWRYNEERSDIRKTRWQIIPWAGLVSPPQSVVADAASKGKTINEQMKDDVIVRLLIAMILNRNLETTGLNRN